LNPEKIRDGFENSWSFAKIPQPAPRTAKRMRSGEATDPIGTLAQILPTNLTMFRIRRFVDGEFVVLALIGRIDDESVAQLKSLVEVEGRKVVLDLQEVNLVSRGAVGFLGQFEEQGGGLQNCPPYVREWISRERNGKRRPSHAREGKRSVEVARSAPPDAPGASTEALLRS